MVLARGRLAVGHTAMRPLQAADVMLRADDQVQPALPLASEGVQRWVWESRYGQMLIEVVGPDVFVNGQKVQPHAA